MNSDFSVIGLLGPAGSGKDLVADWFVKKKGFAKVSFADPMKRFVLKTFQINEDQLWGPSEKRNELFEVDETWWYTAIGNFGTASEEIVRNVLLLDTRVTGYLKLHEWFTTLRRTYPDKVSARFILQTLGTEWGRAVDPLMWIRYAHHIAYELSLGSTRYSRLGGLTGLVPCELVGEKITGVVIPDHRFKNEVEYTHKNGGHVIRLRRLSMEQDRPNVGITGHQSEAEQKELPDNLFHAVYNLPEGIEYVYDMLESTFEHRPWEDQVKDGCVTVDYAPFTAS